MKNIVVEMLKDLSQYPKTMYEWNTLRRPGMGVDYTSEEYRALVKRVVNSLHPARMRLRVTLIIDETPSAKTFRLVRVDGDTPPFRAGQYINLFVNQQGVHTSRPYSISSPPGVEYLDLTVRDVPGGFVAPFLLEAFRVGDSFDSTGPAGSFYHEPLIDGEDLVFVAGGSGITPFMSIIRQMELQGWPRKITLLYGSRRTNDVIFGEELARLAKKNERFRFASIISEPPKNYRGLKGFIDAKLIRKEVGAIAGKTFYLCGPHAMYDFCIPELLKLGVPRHKIKRELYGPPADITKVPGWPAKLKPTTVFTVQVNDQTIQAPAGEPLLNSLERHGLVVPAVCRSGECSACRTRLLSGEVFMPPNAGLRESDRQFGYIHACVAFPISDLVIRL
ncbi:MAG: 2Fe-2S iron-sulfur cluster binding domain-containing protein [Myxococcales bacterium]|nr:2Fe-2S iron-sulfur cluster binding domain-containing protein [Myxococcales bacterium]